MSEGFVYVIAEMPGAERVKLGWSKAPEERLNLLQIGNPRRLRLMMKVPADRAAEGQIHRLFADAWVRGEWFDRLELDRIAGRLVEDEYAAQTQPEGTT